MKLEIKEATIHDIEAIRAIGIQSYCENFSEIWSAQGIEKYLAGQFNKEKLLAEIENGEIKYFTGYIENNCAGFLKINLSNPLSAGQVIELEKIYLLKQYAGKGFGKAILDFVVFYANKKHKKIIQLEVLKNNLKALNFYTAYGFEIIEEKAFSTDILKPGLWIMKLECSLKDLTTA